MTEQIEDRLAALEEELKRTHPTTPLKQPLSRSPRWKYVITSILLALVVVGSGGFYVLRKDNQPIPKNIRERVTFSLYYPTPVPSGYSYRKDSGKIESGIVFFDIYNGNKTIQISEQAVPKNPPDLNNIIGFKKLETIAGHAAIGMSAGKPVAVLLTNTTLVTVTGSQDTPNDFVGIVIKSMSALPD